MARFSRPCSSTKHPRELIGIELQEPYWTRRAPWREHPGTRVEIFRLIFSTSTFVPPELARPGPAAGGGQPPLDHRRRAGKLDSGNVPSKRNLKELPGIEARTGSSNFDIAEAVWIKLLEELTEEQPTIALLCKTSAAPVLSSSSPTARGCRSRKPRSTRSTPRAGSAPRRAACLLRVTLGGPVEKRQTHVPVFATLDADQPRAAGVLPGPADRRRDARLRVRVRPGNCPLTWRQGIKHDVAAVVELVARRSRTRYRNRLGHEVDVEPQFVYPLLKGTDLRKPAADRPRRVLIVTQQRIGQPTLVLEQSAS